MIPKVLCIENFQCHEKSEICFDDFNSALIIGKSSASNYESNGIGKSTIVKAIEYVLFNKVHAKSSEKIIRDGAESCKVSFSFEEDGEVFKIERFKSRKSGSSDLRIYKKISEDSWEDKTQRRISDNEKEIEKLLKINYDAFKNSFLFSQKAQTDLASLTPEKRKLLLKETLNLIIYSKYEKIAKKKLNDLNRDLEKYKTNICIFGDPEKELASIDLSIVQMEKNINSTSIEINSNKKLFDDENLKLSALNKTFQNLENDSVFLLKKQKEIQNDISKLESLKQEYETKLNNLKISGKNLSNELSSLKKSFKEESEKYESFIKNENPLLSESAQFSNEDDASKEIEKLISQKIEKTSQLKTLSSKIEELKIPIPKDGVCKSCRQVLTSEHRDKCQKEINIQLEDFNRNLNSISFELGTITHNIESANKRKNLIISTKNKLKDYSQNISLKEKEVDSKRSMYMEYDALLNKTKKNIDDKITEGNGLKTKHFVDNFEMFNKLKKEISVLKDHLGELFNVNQINTTQLNELVTQKAILEHKKEQKEKDKLKIKDLQDKIDKINQSNKIAGLAASAFGSGGIPSLIINNILEDFQSETNSILSQIKPGIQIKFSLLKENKTSGEQEDTLDIIFLINGKERDYDLISGGQQLAISLCLRLGLVQILRKQFGINIKMLLLDEVDQPLDYNGKEAYADMIKELQKEYKILVITHNDSLKDKFKNVILVSQDENLISSAKLMSSY